MTSTQALSETWRDLVFEHPNILVITTKALPYEVLDESEGEISRVSYLTEVNFFEYLVTRTYAFPMISGGLHPEYSYTVDIRYTREKDTDGSNYQACRDALDTLLETVRTELGAGWNNTIDFWTVQDAAPTIVQRRVAESECWSWILTFNANFRSLTS